MVKLQELWANGKPRNNIIEVSERVWERIQQLEKNKPRWRRIDKPENLSPDKKTKKTKN